MANHFEESDLTRIRTISIRERASKVSVDQIVDPERATIPISPSSFPDILAASDLKTVAASLRAARDGGREMIWLIGAHTIKCGLSLYLRRLIEHGYITCLATTGSATIHDTELAFFGTTSEDVAAELPEGRFGMARETAAELARSAADACRDGIGLGAACGRHIQRSDAPHKAISVFAGAHQAGIPATVHVALGTDIIHQHPDFPARDAAEASMRDFRILADRVGKMFEGGVVVLLGSAVILPEVFLKAVSIGYNLGGRPNGVVAASFDMMPQYRVRENVLSRPFRDGGAGYAITGHHEIMLPLLYALLAD